MANATQNNQEKKKNTAIAVNNAQEVGKIVRWHREKAGLTQIKLAELAGMGKTVIYDIEKGKATVKFATLLKVFKTLNLSLRLSSPLLKGGENS
jgi:y4mF family transcriptional regulator